MKSIVLKILMTVVISFFFALSLFFYLDKRSKAFSDKANMILLPETIPVRKEGERFYVYILLNSKISKLAAVDAVLKFDKDVLEVLESTPLSLFVNYPEMGRKLDNEKGLVYLSAVNYNQGKASFSDPYQNIGLYGRILFKVKKSQATKVDFLFTPNSTTDSNLIEEGTGKDILQDISQLEGREIK